MHLYCDLETFSRTPIKCGAARYAEDPSCRVLLWGYAVDDEPARVWDVAKDPIPEDLRKAIRQVQIDPRSRQVWHNGFHFDAVVLSRVMPDLAVPFSRIDDTMVMAYSHGLPGSLADLSLIYHLGDKGKDKDGARLVRMFCVPDFRGRVKTREEKPEDWERFVNYCRLDVEAERELYKRLPRVNWTDKERSLMVLDAEINQRGMLIDVALARAAVDLVNENDTKLKEKAAALTKGEVDSATRTQAVIDYIKKAFGRDLPSLRKSEVAKLLEEDIPEPMKELLRIRLNSAKAAVKKYQAVLDAVCEDNRLRGCLQFRGASRTGRFSGRLFQPQNLARQTMPPEEVENVVTAVKEGALDLLYSDVGRPLSEALRGLICAPRGSHLSVADYSNIEGRMLAWMAGETWKIKAFEAYDAGTGPDLYKLTYSKAFNVPVEEVTKPQRQMGKVLELAMGYGGGVGAFCTFAAGYGIDLSDMAKAVLPVVPPGVRDDAERGYEWALKTPKRIAGLDRDVWVACDSVKRLWRMSNPAIVGFWHDIESACTEALREHTAVYIRKDKGLAVSVKGNWLFFRLPSGRRLCYPSAQPGSENEACLFSYLGMSQMARRWERLRTYSGKCCENIIQAAACDLLCHALAEVTKAGFRPVLTVHDEIIAEAEDTKGLDHKKLEALMASGPAWATGLPLTAEGFDSIRYHK